MAKELVVKTFDPNQLFYKMVEFYQENKENKSKYGYNTADRYLL